MLADALISGVVWLLFWWLRKNVIDLSGAEPLWLALALGVVAAFAWVMLYTVFGLYAGVRHSIVHWLMQLSMAGVVGAFVFFVLSYLYDTASTADPRLSFLVYLLLQTSATALVRLGLVLAGYDLGLVRKPTLPSQKLVAGTLVSAKTVRQPNIDAPSLRQFVVTSGAYVGGLRQSSVQWPAEETTLHLTDKVFPHWEARIKRFLDVAVSATLLVIMAPLLLLLAAIIRLNTRGPVLFRQERIGLQGRPFTVIKLRSMYMGAEPNGPQTTQEHDPRITPVGRLLRRTRLDELPQLWNVLVGEMSLVGPRPERQFFIDRIASASPHYYDVLTVKPGITGLGQVKNGYAATLGQMLCRLRYDRFYVQRQSLALDLKILWLSFAIVLLGRGR
jgi:lipopolysaccharide/colanic/teichoic acid biosynthesis glycosyltransferase